MPKDLRHKNLTSTSDVVMQELYLFLDTWKASKEKRIRKTPRSFLDIPNPVNRDLSLMWIIDKWDQGRLDDKEIPENMLIDLYAYTTNTTFDLTSEEKTIINNVAFSLLSLYESYNIESSLDVEVFKHEFQSKCLKTCQAYGSATTALHALEFLFEPLNYMYPKRLVSTTNYKWIFYCLVFKGTPCIAIKKNYVPFSPGDPFHKLYVHYKRNPSYDFATYVVNKGNEKHTIIFAIDGSSDTDISRLFWTGKRANCILVPTQTIIDMLQSEYTGELVPSKYQFIMNIISLEGLVSYIDEDIGKWKKPTVPYNFLDLYAEILGVQKRLWKQAHEAREIMKHSLKEIEELALKDEEKIIFKVFNNTNSSPEDVVYKNSCGNLNPEYEKSMYNKFFEQNGSSIKYYAVATSLDNPKNILAFIFADKESDGIVHIDLFCKSVYNKNTKAARYLFGYILKYFMTEYDYVSLEALPMAIPFYEAFGFIRTPGQDDWVLPLQKGKRSIRRLYNPLEFRTHKRIKV